MLLSFAAISDPSEWDTSYLTASYQQRPEVLQQLRSAFAGTFQLPYTSPEQAGEQVSSSREQTGPPLKRSGRGLLQLRIVASA
jgi:hypothetical protein